MDDQEHPLKLDWIKTLDWWRTRSLQTRGTITQIAKEIGAPKQSVSRWLLKQSDTPAWAAVALWRLKRAALRPPGVGQVK